MNKILLTLILGMVFLSFASAQQGSLGTFKQNECVNLIQTCDNCTYNNISRVIYPNSTIILSNAVMTKDDTFYNYTFCNTTLLGTYLVNGFEDLDGTKTVWNYDLLITPSGKISTTSESILYVLFVLILFGLLLTMFYFILIMPNENEKGEGGVIIGIVKLKYLRVFLIAMTYPVIIIILNLMNGLAVQFTSLTIFSGTLGFLFETMLRGVWIFTLVIILWIFYMLVQDSNVMKNIERLGRFKLRGSTD